MDWKRLLILIAAFILYLVIGGLVFSALESTEQELTRVDVRSYKEKILNELPCLSGDHLEALIAKIVVAVNSGLDPANNVTSKNSWDFSSAFFFSGTVVTTIGYGNISPSTRNGQTFCIFYALVGIPIFGILLVAVADKLKKNADRLEKRMNKRFLDHPKIKSTVYSILLLATGILLFMMIPAAIISRIEGWDFSNSFYYTFITLSTIGFGDFVIGTNPDIDYSVLYKWCAYAWIIMGLAFLTLVISFLSDAFTSTADKLEQDRMEKIMKRKGIEGGDGDHKVEEDMKVIEADMIEGDSEEMKDLQQNSSASSA
ncbi:potassium channel subfamily K member 10-like isoform X2 [Asterias amurensis]|uniref:potassium channel subfamily K member 10-like isoform X2 n=1 Tax=Asterias amurensis TaxID=7602 RepID=UPI003AB3413A